MTNVDIPASPLNGVSGTPATLRPGCKVNLYLAIKARYADGYHELDTVFYPLASPCDRMVLTLGGEPGLRLDCSLPGLQGENNIITRAYNAWTERSGWKPGVTVHLEKNIPMGGGLGGGSSDAAAFLTWLNTIAGNRGVAQQELARMGCRLGADVPFFLLNKPCRARGRGELLGEIELDLEGYHGLLVCPNVQVPTAWAYKAWDDMPKGEGEKKFPRILTMHTRPVRYPSSRRHLVLCNDFEKVVFSAYPQLYHLKMAMIAHGAAGCVMSGSGASLFALFDREHERKEACAYLQAQAISYFI
ncbi:4-(cytidine 5'-diphospho)-2-C-methyl-D-erythritol kinase [Desulfoplanes sp.]